MSAAVPPYFIDQYGHIYRWEKVEGGEKSVPVANWQGSGSAKESIALIDKANAYPKLVEALRNVAIGKPYAKRAADLLRELEESTK